MGPRRPGRPRSPRSGPLGPLRLRPGPLRPLRSGPLAARPAPLAARSACGPLRLRPGPLAARSACGPARSAGVEGRAWQTADRGPGSRRRSTEPAVVPGRRVCVPNGSANSNSARICGLPGTGAGPWVAAGCRAGCPDKSQLSACWHAPHPQSRSGTPFRDRLTVDRTGGRPVEVPYGSSPDVHPGHQPGAGGIRRRARRSRAARVTIVDLARRW